MGPHPMTRRGKASISMGTWRNGPLEPKSRKFADKKLDAGVGFDDPSGYEPENSGASLDKLEPGLETEKKS
jgi:hypothetical protein